MMKEMMIIINEFNKTSGINKNPTKIKSRNI